MEAEAVAAAPAVAAPPRAGRLVVPFAIALAVITYVDRVCIAQAAPHIREDLKLSPVQMGWVMSVFYWSYGLFEIPWGWLADRIGAKKVLLRIVTVWSFFTAATGWAWSFSSLLVTRTLFGVGEAGCFPSVTKAFTTWLSATERVRAQGLLWLSARWGGAFTPLVAMVLIDAVSWRLAFAIFGLLGVAWAVVFALFYRDPPPAPKADVAAHPPVPWKLFFSTPRVWLLWIQYIFLAYGAALYVTWIPTFLATFGELSPVKRALLAAPPLFFGGLGSLFCGFFLAWLTRRTGSGTLARRYMAMIGFSGSAAMLLVSTFLPDPVWKMAALGAAGFANDLAMPPSWAACMDMGGRHTGTLSGSMNMWGSIGGGGAPVIAGYILSGTHNNWNMVFYAAAGAYALGMLCWFTLDSTTPLEKEPTS
jgi:MFS transporter, ACS family, glucarate transporter